MIKPQEAEHKKRLLDRVTEFLQRRRKPVIIIGIAVLVFIFGVFAYLEVQNKRQDASLRLAENIQSQYQKWQNASDSDKPDLEKSIIQTSETILKKYPHMYAASRALFVEGNLYWEKEAWSDSAESFSKLAKRFPKSYLAPVALYNAAAATEQSGNEKDALAVLKTLVDTYRDRNAAEVPRALFSMGRITEGLGNPKEAATHYQDLVDNFPQSSWTNLARDRIIYLTTQKKIEQPTG